MRYYSIKDPNHTASFQEAIFRSLPPDGGLYFPAEIPTYSKEKISELLQMENAQIAFEVAKPFVGDEIAEEDLFRIVSETVDFEFPLVQVENNIHALELFHGPTWAFKDCGARLLSRCLGYFTQKTGEEITILVATSGDTGGAVAAGFFNVPGVNVKILFPKGKVSGVQKLQLTTWGGNISAYEIEGTFDDCQAIVKRAFLDKDLNQKYQLSSANSINIARLIPQSFYYFYALKQLGDFENVVISVPSGNFGNLTAGLLAWKMGLPIKSFIAATNRNDAVPRYLQTGIYHPKPSIQTYANAMDVGDPSNFVRILELFKSDHKSISSLISGFVRDDVGIMDSIRQCHKFTNYLLDPHGAIGYQALKESFVDNETGIFLETAHPVKFLDVVQKAIDKSLDYNEKLAELQQKIPDFEVLDSEFDSFKELMLT